MTTAATPTTPTTPATLYRLEPAAAWITLNRPQNRNALSADLVNQLDAHLRTANADPAVRCIVITGTDPAFCAGADLKNPPGKSSDGRPGVQFADVLKAIVESPKPVIAAVNGAAFAGGLGLVGAADIVVAAEDVEFSFSEVRLGVIPAIISVVCLPKLGTHHGMKLFLTGERFSGSRAVELGLVHQAVPRAALYDAVRAIIGAIQLGGPNAVIECKKLVRQVPLWSLDEGLREAAVWSRQMFTAPEAAEGMAAFRDKRPAAWVQNAGNGDKT